MTTDSQHAKLSEGQIYGALAATKLMAIAAYDSRLASKGKVKDTLALICSKIGADNYTFCSISKLAEGYRERTALQRDLKLLEDLEYIFRYQRKDPENKRNMTSLIFINVDMVNTLKGFEKIFTKSNLECLFLYLYLLVCYSPCNFWALHSHVTSICYTKNLLKKNILSNKPEAELLEALKKANAFDQKNAKKESNRIFESTESAKEIENKLKDILTGSQFVCLQISINRELRDEADTEVPIVSRYEAKLQAKYFKITEKKDQQGSEGLKSIEYIDPNARRFHKPDLIP